MNLVKFFMTQTMTALNFFMAIKTALPSLSSLVASCKISERTATQRPRIKIQTNIVPSLRFRLGGRCFPTLGGLRKRIPWIFAARGRSSPREAADLPEANSI